MSEILQGKKTDIMKVIGLTGSSGSGKSTVSGLLKARGFVIVDCDQTAREVLRPETNCLAQIFDTFGTAVKAADGSLDRKALAGIVFSDPAMLQKLNHIMYPQILTDIRAFLEQYRQQKAAWAVLDAPTLFESGADSLCDITISVLADDAARVSRIMARDHISQSMAQSRLRAQQTNAFYRERSDFVIENTTGLSELTQQVERLITELKA